jgi:SEC-C motif-containing protein
MKQTNFCPCGSTKLYVDCCASYISGEKWPESAEKLMRSRYSAYVKNNLDYIQSTMTEGALEDFNLESAKEWLSGLRWQGLTVLKAYPDPQDPQRAYVKFSAIYKSQGRRYEIRELSEFLKKDDRWFYSGGQEDHAHGHGQCGTGCGHVH